MGFKMDPNFEREIARELQKKFDKISRQYAHRLYRGGQGRSQA